MKKQYKSYWKVGTRFYNDTYRGRGDIRWYQLISLISNTKGWYLDNLGTRTIYETTREGWQHGWEVEYPKEDLFTKLYLTLKEQ